ncbi:MULTISPECIES: pyridoxamine 5'-phosphate oxidase family protein [unclassified Lactococcus]|uniref:pyridoxamine 5'-phosphate oxidase family protein n=1 Tax=unclassified Lactococcus TaxID=2643510 RepID=UPI0011C7CC67|nr:MULTISPECIES: pyridoxamine 5'-phosphate oxidase family protein [unclassified Lactococcus]MQW23723.1 pyridoxamine 5'-phosphate oxidase family protein [Lactococcus sp. dk101]TXK37554.1 pyridoxamine 5'-phosphate oxidase family protein [Lactococcus sp. dk310]TXK48927.1 pyridoxamine 5'-phosphate oxidase family protein [Lactococcus sp. dk322]
MYFKRFMQLFLIFLISAAVLLGLVSTNFAGYSWLTVILSVLLAYLILILPLVALTVLKAKKKENTVGSQADGGEFSKILKELPGYIVLSYSQNGNSSTSIMSYLQSEHAENVWYMVSDKRASKLKIIEQNSAVSFTSWFNHAAGDCRLSSNRVTAEIFEGEQILSELTNEPKIRSLHENAAKMALIKLTIHSALFESNKGDLRVFEFEK